MGILRTSVDFAKKSITILLTGDKPYFSWLTILSVLVLIGLHSFCKQLVQGLSLTGLTQQVTWGLYIGNFTYLVGMAAAAVMIVIPVYIYKNKSLHDVVIFGELFAIVSIVMCIMFIIVDVGRVDRLWHFIPLIGRLNWPSSMLAWDVIVLNVYLLLNVYTCCYLLYMRYTNRKPAKIAYLPIIFLSIFWAISIHTVTAFLFVGLSGRPFWNSAVVGARFISSAFSAGLSFIIITSQLIRHFQKYHIADQAIALLRNLLQVALIINLFLLGNELFKEFYTEAHYFSSAVYLYFGVNGHNNLVPWIWTAMLFNLTASLLLILPISRKLKYLNIACVLTLIGIWVEKGIGLVIPGFIPSPLGEILEYMPTTDEIFICVGIWAFGMLLYTCMLKLAVPILSGKLNISNSTPD